MKISEAFKALGDQHLEEQNILGKGLSIGVSTVKEYIENYKLKKFYNKVDKIGPEALKDSPYDNNKEVVLKVIEMEHIFRRDKENQGYGTSMVAEELARIDSYGKERKLQPVMNKVYYSVNKLSLRDDLDVARKASKMLDGIESRFMGKDVLKDLEVAKNSIYWSTNNRNEDLSNFPALQDNKELVMHAVYVDGENLKFASPRLKDDIDVARASCKELIGNNGTPYMSERLKAIAGTKNPVENLQRAIDSEKLSNKLDSKLAPKYEAPTKKMKI